MTIVLKNKAALIFDDFIFRCTIGKKGLVKNKIEGDKKTPIGTYSLGNLYYRKDRNPKPLTKLKCIPIKKDMGWCDDVKNKKFYNKLIKVNKKINHERLFRRDYKYDFVLPINYNTKKPVKISKLQTEVWGHNSKLETHTVETHIYRLRKKIKNIFEDNNFIKSSKSGYII